MTIETIRAPLRALGGARRKLHCAIGATALAVSAFATGAHAGGAPSTVTPARVVVEADRPSAPGVFGTVPMAIRAQPTSSRWSRVMGASLNQPALQRLAARARALSPQQQAGFVQSTVNHAVRNSASAHDCSDDGYWASGGETLTRGVGDCIDIAIAKMEALRLLGVPRKDLYLTTGYVGGRGPKTGRESAALLVRIGGGFWLLSEHSDRIVQAGSEADNLARFFPVLTYGVGATWVHGRRVQTARLDSGGGATTVTR